MGMSFDNIRTGKTYLIRNYGEVTTFQVKEVVGNGDYHVKDTNSLEMFYLSELIKYGKGKDFLFEEVDL